MSFREGTIKEYEGPDPYKGILDFEILNQQEDYLERVKTPGTLEYKLNEKYKHMTLYEFLMYTGLKDNKIESTWQK